MRCGLVHAPDRDRVDHSDEQPHAAHRAVEYDDAGQASSLHRFSPDLHAADQLELPDAVEHGDDEHACHRDHRSNSQNHPAAHTVGNPSSPGRTHPEHGVRDLRAVRQRLLGVSTDRAAPRPAPPAHRVRCAVSSVSGQRAGEATRIRPAGIDAVHWERLARRARNVDLGPKLHRTGSDPRGRAWRPGRARLRRRPRPLRRAAASGLGDGRREPAGWRTRMALLHPRSESRLLRLPGGRDEFQHRHRVPRRALSQRRYGSVTRLRAAGRAAHRRAGPQGAYIPSISAPYLTVIG
jgi:hypothetical protein